MIMRKILIILITIICLQNHVAAQQVNEAQAKQEISQIAAKLKTMKCDFVQTKQLKMLRDKMTSKGKMYYQQSNKLRWEYESPYTYVFVLNDSKVVLKNSKRNDVIDVNQNKIFREIVRIMMNTVVGKCMTDDKDFKVSITISPTEYIATMVPLRKDLKQMFNTIVLHFNRQSKMVSQVELMEKNGDKTIIELKNVQTNISIPTNLFAVN